MYPVAVTNHPIAAEAHANCPIAGKVAGKIIAQGYTGKQAAAASRAAGEAAYSMREEFPEGSKYHNTPMAGFAMGEVGEIVGFAVADGKPEEVKPSRLAKLIRAVTGATKTVADTYEFPLQSQALVELCLAQTKAAAAAAGAAIMANTTEAQAAAAAAAAASAAKAVHHAGYKGESAIAAAGKAAASAIINGKTGAEAVAAGKAAAAHAVQRIRGNASVSGTEVALAAAAIAAAAIAVKFLRR